MSQFKTPNQPLGITLIGNPGSGKSTILNGIAEKSVFRSGNSLGGGLTSVLEQYVSDDGILNLFDTPGLADIEQKKKAGEEIDKVLSKKMSVKIAFVVSLANGRVSPEDAYTLKVVLEAIKSVDVNNMFGVIINQLSPAVIKALKTDKEKALKVRNGITGSFYTSHWVYVETLSQLKDKNDGMLMNEDLMMFFAGLPETKPPEAVVEKVDTSDLEEKLDEQREIIRRLGEANEIEVAKKKKEMEHEQAEAREREKAIKAELKKLKKDSLSTGALMNVMKLIAGTALSVLARSPAPLMMSAFSCQPPAIQELDSDEEQEAE